VTRRILSSALGSAALAVVLTFTGASAAHAVQTRQFTGEGSSDKGFAYDYAWFDALDKAEAAGFSYDQCVVVSSFIWPGGFDATVTIECTR
jgi:hypothetical protein